MSKFLSVHKNHGFVILLLVFLSPNIAMGQMFSVEELERRPIMASSAITFGPDFLEMNSRSDNDNSTAQYDWSDIVYRLRVELPGIHAYIAYGNDLGETDADTLNYFNVGASVYGHTPIARNERVGLELPFRLTMDYERVRSTDPNQPEVDYFRQNSISLGLGLGGYFNIHRGIRLRAEAMPGYGFAVSALGRDSGQLASFESAVRLHFDQLFSRYGVVIGYNYSFRRYSGSDDIMLHNISGNNILIGISF